MREEEGGRRADVLDLTGSHILFYLTSTAHLQSTHQGDAKACGEGGRAGGDRKTHRQRERA